MTEIVVSSYTEWDEAFYAAEGKVVTLFTAPTWCRPCRALEPHWNKAIETLDDYTIIKVDLGSSPEDTVTHWASEMFGIRGVPTIYKWDAEAPVGDHTEVKGRTVVQLRSELN